MEESRGERWNQRETSKGAGVVTVSSLLNGLEEDAVSIAQEVGGVHVLKVLRALNERDAFVESVSRFLRLSVEPWNGSHQELGERCHVVVEEQDELAFELLVVDAVVEITSLWGGESENERVSEWTRAGDGM